MLPVGWSLTAGAAKCTREVLATAIANQRCYLSCPLSPAKESLCCLYADSQKLPAEALSSSLKLSLQTSRGDMHSPGRIPKSEVGVSYVLLKKIFKYLFASLRSFAWPRASKSRLIIVHIRKIGQKGRWERKRRPRKKYSLLLR